MSAWSSHLNTLPQYLSGHLLLSFFALIFGIVVSVPLGVIATRYPRIERLVLGSVGVVQTIPSLALLALMVPLLGGTIGWRPALVALTFYSMLPIVTNTIAGLKEVDRNVVEAGKAVGMTEWQLLRQVMAPLALPVVVAGIRTSVIWVVGTATLATPVGGDSLGYYIFLGLNTRRTPVILLGCIFSALLAIVLDWFIATIQKSLQVRAVKRAQLRSCALVGLVGLGIAAPYLQTLTMRIITDSPIVSDEEQVDDIRTNIASLKGVTVTVGSKNFTEQYILAELIRLHLESSGVAVNLKTGLGSRVLFDALASSDLDIYVDYSGTIWATVMQRQDPVSPQTALIETSAHLLQNQGITVVGPLGFENAYAFAMRRDRAQELGIQAIGDLKTGAKDLEIAGDFDFFGRSEGKYVLEAYGLEFGRRRNMSSRLMYDAIKHGEVDIVTAYTSDGQIAAFDLVLLDDPKGAFPPYDAMLMVSPKAATNRALIKRLRMLVNVIDNRQMQEANKAVDLDGRQISEVAEELYEKIRH